MELKQKRQIRLIIDILKRKGKYEIKTRGDTNISPFELIGVYEFLKQKMKNIKVSKIGINITLEGKNRLLQRYKSYSNKFPGHGLLPTKKIFEELKSQEIKKIRRQE